MKFFKGLMIMFMLIAATKISVFADIFSKNKQDGGQSNGLLEYAASARSLGMGRAFIGVADDASATYWNPAGLSFLDRKNLVTLYSMLEEDTGYGFLSFAQPTERIGSVGLSAVSLRSGAYTRTNDNGDSLGTFQSNAMAFMISDSFSVGKSASFGVTMKAIRKEIDQYSGIGYGADGGFLLRLASRLQWGLVVRNAISPQVKLRSETEKFPTDVGTGFKFLPVKNLVLAADVNRTKSGSLTPSAGLDWALDQLISIRLGFNKNEVATGLGFGFGNWGLDYAFGYQVSSPELRDAAGMHRFGFHLDFGKKPSNQIVQSTSTENTTVALAVPPNPNVNLAPNSQIESAKQLYDAGQYAEAMLVSEQILLLHPDSPEAAATMQRSKDQLVKREISIGKEKMKKKDYVAAYIHLRNARKLAPTNAEASAALQQVERQLDNKSVKTTSGQAVPTAMDSRDRLLQSLNLYNLGLQMAEEGRIQEAEITFNKALQYADDNYLRDALNKAILQVRSARRTPAPNNTGTNQRNLPVQ